MEQKRVLILAEDNDEIKKELKRRFSARCELMFAEDLQNLDATLSRAGICAWSAHSATPTKTPVKILHFAESKKEPLSRKIPGKAARNALDKGTGPSNLPKSILASFCHASKNGCKKARKPLKLLGFSRRYLFWFY